MDKGDMHYGLSMDHREDEVDANLAVYGVLAELLGAHDTGHSLSSPESRYSDTGLAALIMEFEGQRQAPGRYHAMAFGGDQPEELTATLGKHYHTNVLTATEKGAVSLHASDITVQNCQALMLNTILEGKTVYFHVDDINNMDAIVNGSAAGNSVTTHELLFIRANWKKNLGPLHYVDRTDGSVKTKTAQFNEQTVKFFNRGKEIPSPFG